MISGTPNAAKAFMIRLIQRSINTLSGVSVRPTLQSQLRAHELQELDKTQSVKAAALYIVLEACSGASRA